ncbi:hypothetical protein [Pseudofulvibacter geojedonensis]|uniref:Lipoprotein n=1 Tax=Pseudofulvibacter geojedonensis TaxID=1123758 RepID=A0ABW3I4J3_9FLAO
MKKLTQLFTLALLLILVSCGKEKNNSENTEINNYLNDITSLENIEKTPIKTITSLAKESASKIISLKKSNMKESLEKASNFTKALVIVGNHTVVKITNLKDCKQSGSWATCMPMGEGYIKKGKLNHKKDYLNNIIGLPDNQERILYLFN